MWLIRVQKDLNKSTQYSSSSTSARQYMYYSVGEEFMTSGTKFGLSYRVEGQLAVKARTFNLPVPIHKASL